MLDELTVVIAVGMLVAVVLSALRLPTAAGLLAAGALMGPNGFGLVESAHSIEILAEVGVILLLFTIGLEFSLERLARIAGLVMIGGALQVGLTSAATVALAMLFDTPLGEALVYGFVVSLSSTAIVLRGLAERGELDAPHGRFVVGVLIFQDLSVVPMMLVIPLLGGSGGGALPVLFALGKAALVVALVLVLSRRIVPPIFGWVDRTKSREVFLLAVLSVCIGTAWLTSLAGLSLALGAFLGGMVVAGTEYGSRAMGDILPLRDVFMSVFFVSLGMLFDGGVVTESPVTVALLLSAFVLGKGLLASLAAMAMRFPARVAFLAGVGLAQFGEFGFILVGVADAAGVIEVQEVRALLSAGIVSMFLTPVLVRMAPHVSAGARLLRPLERLLGVRGIDECKPEHRVLASHVLVVGYGVAGRLLAEALAKLDIPYLIIELNAEVVRRAARDGKPIYYGDVTSEEALHHANIETARAAVLLINDRDAAERAVATIRRSAPELPILLRSRYLASGKLLLERGATDVVYEEVEAGVEMLARVLRGFDVPRNLIDEQLREARASTQASARQEWMPRKRLGQVSELDDLEIDKVLLRAGDFGIGKAAVELELRQRTGALAVAVKPKAAGIVQIDPARSFEDGDCIYLVGAHEQVLEASRLLTSGNEVATRT